MKTCVITGASSMIGLATLDALHGKNLNILPLYHTSTKYLHCDLTDWNDVKKLFNYLTSVVEITYIIHLAGFNGNIQFSLHNSADIYYRTTQMALNVLRASYEYKVHKVVSILSSCAYPDKGVLEEKSLWDGEPNETIRCHGLSKRNLHAFSREVHKQYGVTAVCAILNNSMGPGDSYDVNKTKVIGGLIKKFADAKEQGIPEVICWGSGQVLREFVYSKDAGKAIVQTMLHYNDVETPLNIASGEEISIKDLSELISTLIGYEGIIKWDTSKVDGQKRKKLDLTRMHQHISFKITPLKEALKATIDHYYEYRHNTQRPLTIPD